MQQLSARQTLITHRFLPQADPAARWKRAHGRHAFFAYCTNDLIDLADAVTVEVEPTTTIRPVELSA